MLKLAKQLLIIGALAALSTGCVSRQILAFDDHPNHPLTTLQAFQTKSYFFWKTYEHQYFLCTDMGDKLVCKRSCGGSTDLTCPLTMDTGYNSTNVR